MSDAYESARKAVQWGFLLMGVPLGTLVPRLAEIKAGMGASDGGYGSAVALAGLGALGGNWLGARVAHHFGTRNAARRVFSFFMIANLMNTFAPNVQWLAVVALSGGLTYSVVNVSMNSQGSLVEQGLHRSFLPRAHAFWSLGALVASLTSSLIAPFATPRQSLLTVFVACIIGFQIVTRGLLPERHEDRPQNDESQLQRHERIPAGVLRFLILLSAAYWLGLYAEIAVGDWGSVLLHEDLGVPIGPNGYAITTFMLFQMIGRFNAPRIVDRRSLAFVVRTFGLTGGLGFLVFLLLAYRVHSQSTMLALVCSCLAYGFMGLGVAPMPPAWISAAAAIPGLPSARAIALQGAMASIASVASRLLLARATDAIPLPLALCSAGLAAVVAASMAKALVASNLQRHAINKEAA